MSIKKLTNSDKILKELSKDEKIIGIRKNKYYDSAKPLVTVTTPIYNRINIIDRVLNSVKNQVYRNFEYIIVDDGSTDGVEEKIYKYMDEVDFPVLFVRKKNGGVHTARNIAIKLARGKYDIGLDSDDEMLPNALSTFLKAWESIPKEKVNEYREVVALYENENHEVVGEYFPDNMNTIDKEMAQKLCSDIKGDHFSMSLTKILKETLSPEPKGVKYVSENIMWRKLDKIYRAYYINEPLGINHQDGDDHMGKSKKNIQIIINMLYATSVYLNDRKTYFYSFKEKIMSIIRYQITKNIIKRSNTQIYFDTEIKDKNIKFFMALLYIPCLFGTEIYLYKNKELKDYIK